MIPTISRMPSRFTSARATFEPVVGFEVEMTFNCESSRATAIPPTPTVKYPPEESCAMARGCEAAPVGLAGAVAAGATVGGADGRHAVSEFSKWAVEDKTEYG